jgi:hypothetical protein
MSLRSAAGIAGERGKRPAQDLVVPSDSEHVGDRLRPNFLNRLEIMDALLDQ